MKDKLIYIVIFAAAFALVTGGVVYMNSVYKNIFAFDFTPAGAVARPDQKEKKDGNTAGNEKQNNPAPQVKDSVNFTQGQYFGANEPQPRDTIVKTVVDSSLADSVRILNNKIKELVAKNEIKKDNKKSSKKDTLDVKPVQPVNAIQPSDSIYKAWVKKTVSLYESMDAKKAAKIIVTYSDNIAKDILFTMKKKKAADILAQLSPETVNRITRTK